MRFYLNFIFPMKMLNAKKSIYWVFTLFSVNKRLFVNLYFNSHPLTVKSYQFYSLHV